MFERFTDRGRRVVVLAQEEARLLNHNYIGTEHILLGLLQDSGSVAAKALDSLKVSREAVRSQVKEIIGQGGSAPSGHIPFTPRAKKVLELSLREAIELGHNYIGTEHILLGLVREGEGVAAQVLVKLGADLSRVRQKVTETLSDYQPDPSDLPSPAPGGLRVASAGFGTTTASPASHCSFCGRDLWEVTHHVTSSTASICADCISAGRQAIEAAAAADEPGWGAVHLPPRVFGPEPDDPDSAAAIERAFQTVFTSSTDEARSQFLEDGLGLLSVLAEARARAPAAGTVSVRMERIRFLDDRRARVRFAILLGRAGGPSFDGEAMKTEGRWRVSRATFCQVVAMIGIRCPDPSAESD